MPISRDGYWVVYTLYISFSYCYSHIEKYCLADVPKTFAFINCHTRASKCSVFAIKFQKSSPIYFSASFPMPYPQQY